MFVHVEEAQAWIEQSKRFGDKFDLHRMEIACEKLGHPERKFPSVHVAGTNGKGSTTNYIKNILVSAGYKTGIYTSPYVVRFNERIGINDDDITDEAIVMYANRLKALWDEIERETGESVTFFEILTLMAFLYFADQLVEIAVIEVGLGGTLDATNVIEPVVSVITNISYDHMKQLGDTLESIASNKLGIVKQHGHLITTVSQETLFEQFRTTCQSRQATIQLINTDGVTNAKYGETTSFDYQGQTYQLSLPGVHQITNAVLALEVAKYLITKGYGLKTENMQEGLQKTRWPGRFEIFNHNIVLDGAHNVGGFASLHQSIQAIYPDKLIKCVFCMMKDKEHFQVIHELDTFVDEVVFTEIEYPRRADAETLYEESQHPKKSIEKDFRKAIDRFDTMTDQEVLLITGSLYFISEARKYILQKTAR